MLLGLTAGQRLGLALVAAIFIAFAVASSIVLPRRNPDFPGPHRVKLFSAISVGLAVAMIGAMFVLAVEAEEEAHPEEAVETVGEPPETEPPRDAVEGDPEAGAQVFAAEGCGGCHTLGAAGATGTIAPSLDETQPSFEEAVVVVTQGRGAMPAFGDRLSAEEIRDVARFVSEASRGE